MSVEVLQRAIEIMDGGKKWTNNVHDNPGGCYCIYTALLEAHRQVFHHIADYSAYPAGLDRLLRAGGVEYRSELIAWNDRPGRTWDDVKALLERAMAQPGLAPAESESEEPPDGA